MLKEKSFSYESQNNQSYTRMLRYAVRFNEFSYDFVSGIFRRRGWDQMEPVDTERHIASRKHNAMCCNI